MEQRQHQQQPVAAGPGVDLTGLPDEGWIHGRNLDLEKLDRTGSTEGLAVVRDGEQKGVVVLTVRGAKTGRPQRVPLMRVEHDGCYAAVASRGGSAKTPAWYYNLKANSEVLLQDLTTIGTFSARELVGDERALWWDRSVEVFHQYAEYAKTAARLIPVFLIEPVDESPTTNGAPS